MTRKFILTAMALFLILAAILPAGCGPTPPGPEENKGAPGEQLPQEPPSALFPIQVKDYLGREITIQTTPEAIVSLAPSHTEILFALELGDKIIGVTDYCDYPEEALDIEKIGGFSEPSLEKIISLEPDLVLGNLLHYGTLTSLEQAGIPALALEPQKFDQILATIQTIGAITGKGREAENLTAALEKDFGYIKEKIASIPREKRPTVFFEIWHDPLTTVGTNTLLYEILEITAGQIISNPTGDRYPLFSFEKLVEEDPDFYFATRGSMSDYTDLLERKGWEVLSAVQNRKIHIISDENIIYREGPRLVKGLKEIAGALYPHLFGEE